FDGDGLLDAAIDIDKAYFRGDELALELTPTSGHAFGVNVRAWGLDPNGNRIAFGGPTGDQVTPGDDPEIKLTLSCFNGCDPAYAPPTQIQPFTSNAASLIGGVAAGRFLGAANPAGLAIGLPGTPESNVIGDVALLLRPGTSNATTFHLNLSPN